MSTSNVRHNLSLTLQKLVSNCYLKVKVQGHTIAAEAHSTRRYRRVHSTRRYRRVQLFLVGFLYWNEQLGILFFDLAHQLSFYLDLLVLQIV